MLSTFLLPLFRTCHPRSLLRPCSGYTRWWFCLSCTSWSSPTSNDEHRCPCLRSARPTRSPSIRLQKQCRCKVFSFVRLTVYLLRSPSCRASRCRSESSRFLGQWSCDRLAASSCRTVRDARDRWDCHRWGFVEDRHQGSSWLRHTVCECRDRRCW